MATLLLLLLVAAPSAAYGFVAQPRTLSVAKQPRMLSVHPPPRDRSRSAFRPPNDPFVREAEIKHGRVAMTAAGVLACLAAQGVPHPASALSGLPASEQLLFFASVGTLEAGTYLPRLRSRWRLADGVVPGRFLPASLPPPPSLAVRCEDAVGRLAMCCVLPFMVYDVFT